MTTSGRASTTYRVGIDVGGTFTDVVLVEEQTGRVLGAKVDTVPRDPSEGCLAGLRKALDAYAIDPSQISFIVHGTTIATNTIIEGKGAKAGLIATDGFRDVLEIAYQTRPSLYDIRYRKIPPLIPRSRCIGVPERIGSGGEILTPLCTDAVREAARGFLVEGVEAIVVAFLHSYKNAEHERLAESVLREVCGDLPIVVSSDVCPEFREYPRTSTAVVNGVLIPIVGPYVSRLEERLREVGVRPGLHLMTSAGGIMTAELAKRFPVHLVESGPAAGVIGATFIAGLSGHTDLLALDIGGTTAKVALIKDGQPRIAEQFEVGASAVAGATAPRGQGYPILTPVISLVEIGAGGGSIAHIDPGGALKVGPQSAGADPGPACYGRGGTLPTITDANLVLGRINPDYFLGAAATLRPELSHKAIRDHIASRMQIDAVEAARAIVEIANARMASALHFVSVEQGIDPRNHTLVPSGGAGPMLAAEIARRLGVRRVLIPPTPGLNSAVGLLATDLRYEMVRTYIRALDDAGVAGMPSIVGEMDLACETMLRGQGLGDDRISLGRQLDMCYLGQSFQLRVRFDGRVGPETVDELARLFHARHAEAYGFANDDNPIQIVNIRVTGIGAVDRPVIETPDTGDGPASRAAKSTRPVHFDGKWIETALYDRALLRVGDTFDGPAVVEQMDTTTVVPPGTRARVEQHGSLMLDVGRNAP